MRRRMIVLGRMLVLGRIAAPHVSTGEAEPQMYPAVAHLQAFFASFGFGLGIRRALQMFA